MGAIGTALVDFGTFPGSGHASLAITGQTGILSTSVVEAWVHPAATADHTSDEHIADPPRVVAADISVGVGFTIHLVNQDRVDGIDGVNCGKGPGRPAANSNNAACYGVWAVAWVWN